MAETVGYEERLAELEEQLALLQKRRADLNKAAEHWRRERDKLNNSTRSLRAEALKHRLERDQVNQRIAEIKRKIEALRNELGKRQRKLAEIDDRLEENRRRLPQRQVLKEKLRRIEWELMTTPTTDMKDRERVLVEDAQRLRRMFAAHDELDTYAEERMRILADIKAKELEIRGQRGETSRLNEMSKANHEKMIMLHSKADEERSRADDAHAKFLEYLSAIRRIDGELNKTIQKVIGIRERLRESERKEAAERKRMVEARRMELMKEARKKLEAGERLNLDEMKLLYGEEEKDKA